MTQPFPSPPIKPFERVQVHDGLLMNADRWRRAHDYHKERQNVHFQSLNQPGIVCGLGVRLIPAPEEVIAQYRDGRWIQIQPGIAIDLLGNLIVVPQPIDFRISSENLAETPMTVYLVVSYVDPEKLSFKQQRDLIQETFRIDEKPNPPSELEVELCRFLLKPDVGTQGLAALENPGDVFFPGLNTIDLRYRSQARSRPQSLVRVAQLNEGAETQNDQNLSHLWFLLQSVASLYPALQGDPEIGQVAFSQGRPGIPLQDLTKGVGYDLLYLKGQQSFEPNDRQLEALKNYLDRGGVFLVEAPPNAKVLADHLKAIAQTLGNPLVDWQDLNRLHPLRTQPFLFAALPTFNRQSIQLWCGGPIVLILGEISRAWGLDEDLALPRESIRTAQELGINILNFAWRRRNMTQLCQSAQPTPTAKKQETQDRAKSAKKAVFDKLDF
jgi:hypothetical protein